MKNKLKIQYSDVDKYFNVKLFCVANFVQNNMTDLFGQMNLTNEWLKEHHGAFWVVSKLKIHFDRYPLIGDELLCDTFVSDGSKVRLNLTYNFSDAEGKKIFVANHELCVVDVVTRKIRQLGAIIKDEYVTCDKVLFSKFKWNVEDFIKAYSYTIMYDDIDSNGHVNNARYLSFIANALGSEFFNRNRITDVEVHYINECIEGTHINVYRKSSDGWVGVMIKCGQTEVLKAKIITSNYI